MSSQYQFISDFLTGGISGAVAKTLCAPIERVKLLLQTGHTNHQLKVQYSGMINCFSRVYTEEGILAFWRGNMANVIRYFPTTAINFSVKDLLQRTFVKGIDPENQKFKYFIGNLISGGTAGAIGLSIVYPLDFARTRLGTDIGKSAGERQFTGMGDCLKKIVAIDGIGGLYQGFGVSVTGIFIYRAFYFGGYDSGKRWVFGDDETLKKANFFKKFFFAQFVVTTSETISFPLDTVRRKLMMQSGRKGTKIEIKYNGTLDCFKKTLAEEGVTGFFKGNVSNIWRSVGSSLVLVLYDQFKTTNKKH